MPTTDPALGAALEPAQTLARTYENGWNAARRALGAGTPEAVAALRGVAAALAYDAVCLPHDSDIQRAVDIAFETFRRATSATAATSCDLTTPTEEGPC